jgi:UDP-N-acetylmuramoyl-tripeptide--D-alanyl-D-alanine ligase
MRGWSAEQVAAAAGGTLVRGGAGSPKRVVIDSREVGSGDFFVGLPGERADGGSFAAGALEAGAWGVLVASAWARDLPGEGAVIAVEDPVTALGALAQAWRRELGADVIAVTGSVGKTSTKDLIAALIAPHRAVVANPANYNTEIGLPLAVLGAPVGTEVLVLEMGMRGFGQIAELAAIAEPDVGVVTAIGPVHVEQVGSLEGVAQAKGELLVALRDGATAVVPAGEERLDPWLRSELLVVTFGPGGDVELEPRGPHAVSTEASSAGRPRTSAAYTIRAGDERVELELPFSSAHNLRNTLAAVAAARAVGVRPEGRVEVRFGALRGEHVQLPGGAVVINDCYNANPLSMRAALDDLSLQEPARRRVAVLGDMLELGADEREHHRQIGAYAAGSRVDVLVTVGPLAAEMGARFEGEVHAVADAAAAARLARELLQPGDVVLVKGSRGVGLEVVAEALSRGSAPTPGRPNDPRGAAGRPTDPRGAG